jgi:hypothetical protein
MTSEMEIERDTVIGIQYSDEYLDGEGVSRRKMEIER